MKILNSLNWFQPKEVRTTGIALDGNQISVVQVLETPSGSKLEKVLSKSLQGISLEAQQKEIQDFFEENKVQTSRVAVCFPQRRVVVKYLQVPSRDSIEIKHMMSLQSNRQVPLPPAETVTDYEIIRSSKDGYSQVMLAVARSNEMTEVLDLLEGAGGAVDKIIITSQAVHQILSARQSEDKSFCFIEVDHSAVTFGSVENGKLTLSRSISMDSNNGQKDSLQWRKRIIEQFGQTIGQNPGRIIVTGMSKGLEVLSQELSTQFKCSVECQDVFEKDLIKDQSNPAEAPNLSFLPALGAAWSLGRPTINLLPNGVKSQRASSLRKKELVTLMILLSVFGFCLLGILAQKVSAKREYVQHLDQKLMTLSPKVKKAEGELNRTKMIRSQIDPKGSILEVLEVLNQVIPRKISLTVLTFERNRSVKIQGTAPSLSEAVNLVNGMERSPLFTGVELRSSSIRRIYGREMVDFQLEGHI